jgi:hypothetical protein
MLKKKPDERYSTPQEVASALEPFVASCDLANLLARARRNTGVEDDGPSLARTNEYLSAPSTETEADAKAPLRAKANRTDRFEKTQLMKSAPRPAAWYRRPAFVAAIALGAMGLLLAAVVISIMTDKGELIVCSEDDNIEVTVKRHNGKAVEDLDPADHEDAQAGPRRTDRRIDRRATSRNDRDEIAGLRHRGIVHRRTKFIPFIRPIKTAYSRFPVKSEPNEFRST